VSVCNSHQAHVDTLLYGAFSRMTVRDTFGMTHRGHKPRDVSTHAAPDAACDSIAVGAKEQ